MNVETSTPLIGVSVMVRAYPAGAEGKRFSESATAAAMCERCVRPCGKLPRSSPASTVNAYLQPILARYIDNLDARLKKAGIVTPQKYIMQSNGGMSTFAGTAKKAVATVLSNHTRARSLRP